MSHTARQLKKQKSSLFHAIFIPFIGSLKERKSYDRIVAKRKNYIDIFKQLDLNDTSCQGNEKSVIQ